jgi:hypothetical protein
MISVQRIKLRASKNLEHIVAAGGARFNDHYHAARNDRERLSSSSRQLHDHCHLEADAACVKMHGT